MGDEALFARLRRLRRDPARDAVHAPARDVDPAGTPERARAADGERAALRAALRARRGVPAPELAPEEDPRARTVGLPAGLAERGTPAGAFAERVLRLPGSHRHGDFALDEVAHASRHDLATLARDPALGGLDLERAVFLDIETTGLGGGAGTIPFLVALGRFEGGDFELWQGFLRGPEEEHALLLEVAERVRASAGVVSFFGKSFDRHRLEDKMRLFGVPPPFAERPHLDLYHPCARLYREACDDGRLSTMERELCGVERDGDLPGAFAPEAWHDFLADRAHLLEAVFRHNADDVLSLVTLAAHLGRSLAEERADGRPLSGSAGARARGIARLLAEERRREEALAWVGRARERTPADERPWRSLEADLLRLSGRRAEARALYETLKDEGEDELAAHAWIELAKLAEHGARDPFAALAACERAARLLARAPLGRLHRRLSADLDRRLARLRARVGAPDPPGPDSPGKERRIPT